MASCVDECDAATVARIDEIIDEVRAAAESLGDDNLRELGFVREMGPVAESLRELPRAGQAAAVRRIAEQIVANKGGRRHTAVAKKHAAYVRAKLFSIVAERLLARRLPFTPDDLLALLKATVRGFAVLRECSFDHATRLATTVEKSVGDGPIDPRLKAEVTRLAELCHRRPFWGSEKLARRWQALASRPAEGDMKADRIICHLPPKDVWAAAACGVADGEAAWASLLNHAMSASAGKPSAKWAKTAATLREAVGEEAFTDRMCEWLPLADHPRDMTERERQIAERNSMMADPMLMTEPGELALKGLCWTAAELADGALARAVGGLAASAYKKRPGVGPRAVKVGNAAVWALGRMPSDAALAQLASLKARVKFGTAQRLIGKAFAEKAEAMGVPAAEVEEMAVPAFGLTEVGRRKEVLGEFTALVEVDTAGKSTLTWRKPDGKTQKSVPAAVKADFAEELKDLKAANKDVAKMMPAQKERLDGLFLRRTPWPAEDWRARYFDHPLVGVLARRLIWIVSGPGDGTAVMHAGEGRLEDVEGRPVELDGPSEVRLWHPLDGGGEAWKDRLDATGITQPFKQAHREVYPLTDAERTTATYSNRFAAHVLKQHQFNALAKARGWTSATRLMVDDSYAPPSRRLPEWGLRAEFWVEGVGDDYTPEYVLDSGSFRYVATDQVRFYPVDAADNWSHATGGGYGSQGRDVEGNQPLRLEDVPAKAFSEVMRDVDLFVGVASVGNDPQWEDGGPEGRFRDYWQSYSFGDLSATAQTRREVLARLVPRLKIADRCTLEDRFLVVRGDVRTYRVHLGSGNILMEPNDQYLCIVPDASTRRGGPSVVLPFEGDRTLSLILSKAMLLADDTSITDRTILSQISRS